MLINFFQIKEVKLKKENLNYEIFAKIKLESVFFCRFLSKFFKDRLISFQINPVKNLEEFKNNPQILCKKNKKVDFIFVNFGANFDIKNFLLKKGLLFQNIYIIDNSSCINFRNIESKRIFVTNLKKIFDFKSLHDKKLKNSKTNDYKFSLNFFGKIKKTDNNSLWLNILILSKNLIHKQNYLDIYVNEAKIIIKNSYLRNKKKFFFFKENNSLEDGERKTIATYNEFPLYLLKDWNLFEAFINNKKIGIHFQIWKKKGIKKVSKFFFELGFTLKEANQPWEILSKKKKTIFEKKFIPEASRWGLNFRCIKIFKRIFFSERSSRRNDRFEISAFDSIFSLESLADFKLSTKAKYREKLGFWSAFNSVNEFKNLKKGICVSQKIYKFISSMSRIIICKKIYISERLAFYVFIKNPKNLVISYLLLRDLSLYLIEAISKGKKEKTICIFFRNLEKTWVFGTLIKSKKSGRMNNYIRKNLEGLGAIFSESRSFFLETNSSSVDEVKKVFR